MSTSSYVVIKIGGELVSPEGLSGIAKALVEIVKTGTQVVLVHGGGPQATELTKRLGLTPVQIAGRRVTDAAVLQVMMQSLAGEVSVRLAAALQAHGLRVLALHGVSGGLVKAVKRPARVISGGPAEPVDLGFVGDVTEVNTELLKCICALGYIPAVASIGGDDSGGVWNINADIVAAKTAASLRADKLLLVSNVSGVLRDIKDPSSRIPLLTSASSKESIASGIIQGGMIPKVEEALSALSAGVKAVHICGASEAELLGEFQSPGSRGTVFTETA
jgi:acetylglutamate kinase